MAGRPRVVSAILFSPRGGSSHAARALSARLPDEGWDATLLAGSRSDRGPEQDARAFYAGVPGLRPVDFTPALRAADPMAPPPGTTPMHPSYEDRPGAPDRCFAALGPAALDRQVRAWSAALTAARAERADVLHLHHLTPIDAAAALVAPRVPVVTHLHGTELLLLEAIDGGAAWPHAAAWAERLRGWAARSTRLVVATPGGRTRASDLLGVPRDRVAVVPNGVDAAAFSPFPTDRAATWRELLLDRARGWAPGGEPGSWRAPAAAVDALAGETTFLYVGRFTAVKRVPLLIEAFTRARERLGGGISLVIVGGHPGEWEGEHPAEAIDRLGATAVLLAGWQDQRALPGLLRASDVVVLPSVNESFGQVLVEAMACEIPAIAVDRGGPAEIVDDGRTGWLVAPDDGAGLEQAITAAATDPQERRRRGRAARRDVLERYTWDAATRDLDAVLREAVPRRPAARRPAPLAV